MKAEVGMEIKEEVDMMEIKQEMGRYGQERGGGYGNG